jgi:Aerotolerance regulator N-terminal/von Willebrand factor type A domain
MTFLNVLLLGGTAAGLIPLAIHLLQRKDCKTVRWGAMQFLLAKTINQRRRIQIEQWLLLLVRISIPILLAACMARPLLSSLTPSKNTTPLSLVLLLDDSPSMAAGESSINPFSAAKAVCSFLLEKLPRGSEVSLVPLGNPDVPLAELTVNSSGTDDLLKKHTSTSTPAQIDAGLEAAAAILKKAHQARRRIVLLTDFQKSNWSQKNIAACKSSLERLREQTPPSSLVLYDSGTPSPENVALESLEYSKLPLGAGQRLRFVATLRNYGNQPQAVRSVHWKIDGVTLSTKQASIGARESTQIVFEHSFKNTGSHTVQVVSEPDLQPSDDTIAASIYIHEPIPVLIVNGRFSPEPMLGESDFLEIALSPKNASGPQGASLMQPTVIEPSALNPKALARCKIVILADVRSITKQQVTELETFVRGGGGLLVFPGRQTDVDWNNKNLHNAGLGLLPAQIDALHNAASAEGPEAALISKTLSTHPVVEPFSLENDPFAEIKIWNWYSLKVPDSKNPSPSAASPTTILSLDNGNPLFIERAFGAGTVIQSALPCSAAWSNLPTRPAYVPLFQRLALHSIIAGQPSGNLLAGQTITLTVSPKYSNQLLYLTTPDGTTSQSLPRDEKGAAIAEFFNTRQPGIYHLTLPDGESLQYAANVPREESDPARFEPAEAEAIAAQMGASLARNTDELLALDRSEGGGREIWRPFLFLTLLLLFAELFLTQRFTASKGVRK